MGKLLLKTNGGKRLALANNHNSGYWYVNFYFEALLSSNKIIGLFGIVLKNIFLFCENKKKLFD